MVFFSDTLLSTSSYAPSLPVKSGGKVVATSEVISGEEEEEEAWETLSDADRDAQEGMEMRDVKGEATGMSVGETGVGETGELDERRWQSETSEESPVCAGDTVRGMETGSSAVRRPLSRGIGIGSTGIGNSSLHSVASRGSEASGNTTGSAPKDYFVARVPSSSRVAAPPSVVSTQHDEEPPCAKRPQVLVRLQLELRTTVPSHDAKGGVVPMKGLRESDQEASRSV